MTKWTTLARLKDDMWEESRQYGCCLWLLYST